MLVSSAYFWEVEKLACFVGSWFSSIIFLIFCLFAFWGCEGGGNT